MSLCLWKSVDRAKYDLDEQGYNAYVSSNHTLSYISIAVCMLLSLIFKDQVEAFCNMDDVMFFVGFGYVFAYTSILFMQRREKQLMRYKASTLITLLTVVPATVISLVWMYIGKQNGLQVAAGTLPCDFLLRCTYPRRRDRHYYADRTGKEAFFQKNSGVTAYSTACR